MTYRRHRRIVQTFLAGVVNLSIFAAIIGTVGKTDFALPSYPILLFLAVISTFCITEGWLSSARYEVFCDSGMSNIDNILALATGILLFIVFVVSLLEYLLLASIGNDVLHIFACLAAFLGIYLRAASIRALGPAFTTLPKVLAGRKLVKKGAFRAIRHPSEAGLICISVGIICLMGSVAGAAIFLAFFLPTTYFRLKREEEHLIENYGRSYLDYIAAVPAVFPRSGFKANNR